MSDGEKLSIYDPVAVANTTDNISPSDVIGNKTDTKASGVLAGTESIVALLKASLSNSPLVLFGDITGYTDTKNFVVADFIGWENNFFKGWGGYLVRDDAGAGAIPQGSRVTITGYTSATGALVTTALSAAGAVGDQFMLVHPILMDAWNLRGGTETLQSIREVQQAELDFAKVETIASPVTLTGSIQYIYSQAPGRPFYFPGGFFSWDSGAWAGGETVDINVQVQIDGTNWVDCWNAVQLAAAASPLEFAIPHEAAGTLLGGLPKGFWVFTGGVRVGIIQNAAGAGYHVVSHSFGDGVPGN